jgi:transcription termination/antitermination protein NusG
LATGLRTRLILEQTMSDPIDNPIESTPDPSEPETGSVENGAHSHTETPGPDVNEEMPAGGYAEAKAAPRKRKPRPKPAIEAEINTEPEPEPADVKQSPAGGRPAEAATAASADDEPQPDLVWYVLKVQSSREDTIRDALKRRVKIQGLKKYFGEDADGNPRIVVPTEKITEIRNNKKRIVERKTYPGYIMVQMELNEKTWFLVRETPGVGDFVGAHGTPTKMTDAEVNQMLHQEEEKTTAEAPKVRIDVERGDRVKIKDGPFENFEGTVEEVIEGRGLVKVMLIIFNRPTPVDLEYWQLERI